MKRPPTLTLLSLIVVVATLVRLPNLESSPPPKDNRDELAWAWAGQSLIQDHSPSSWSYLHAYPHVVVQRAFDGTPLPYVHHWLDHPPLFALLVGALAVRAGERTPQAVTPGPLRRLPLLLSLVSLGLLYLLARRLAGEGWALLAAALFAVSPWNAEMAHCVEAEWLLAPMLLGVLLLVPQRGRLAAAGLVALCALAPLVKVVGIAVGISAALLLLVERRWWLAIGAAGAAAAGMGGFVLYGVAVDRAQFVAVWQAQSARHGSLVAGWQFLASLRANLSGLQPLHDPFWYAGLLAVGATALIWRDLRYLALIVPVVVYTAIIALTGSDRTGELVYNAGWYRITLYPLIFVALVAVLRELVVPPAGLVRVLRRRGLLGGSG